MIIHPDPTVCTKNQITQRVGLACPCNKRDVQYGNPDFLLEFRNQLLCGVGLEQTCHILDAKHMRALPFNYTDRKRVFSGCLHELLINDFIHVTLHGFQKTEGSDQANQFQKSP